MKTLIACASVVLPAAVLAQPAPQLLLNQVGSFTDQPVQVVWHNPPPLDEPDMQLRTLQGDQVDVDLDIGPPRFDSLSGSEYRLITLPRNLASGRYQLHGHALTSAPVVREAGPLLELMHDSVRSFYLQRCGEAIADERSGLQRPMCHTQDALRRSGDLDGAQMSPVAATGGWHDAGDYGKYVATTSVAVARLIDIWLRAPDLFGDDSDIPESGNGVPDILDEARVGLDWMLKLQRSDGAVYRKLSGIAWPSELSPEGDQQTRYVFGVSSADTAKAAASWYLAARASESIWPQRAKAWRQAADSAWDWLQQLEQPVLVRHEQDNLGSGPYVGGEWDQELSLYSDADDMLFLAIERWLDRGDRKALAYAQRWLARLPLAPYEWKNASQLGRIHLLEDSRSCARGCAESRRRLIEYADGALARSRSNAWGVANLRFVWGSNKMTAEEGLLLLAAWRASGEDKYRQAAAAQLDYLLGRNVLNQCFVTGYGAEPVRQLLHNDSRVRELALPGMLAGGPNSQAQDGVAPKGLGMRSYLDSEKSWATNETAIDYNAALIGLIGELALAYEGVGGSE